MQYGFTYLVICRMFGTVRYCVGYVIARVQVTSYSLPSREAIANNLNPSLNHAES